MRSYKFIVLLFLLSFSLTTNAHMDFWVSKTFGNVRVRIKTGFDYEEIKKAWIIGKLTQKLAATIQYKDTIFLDFNHHYVGDCQPDYFISFDDGSIKQTGAGADTIYFLKNKALVIREVGRKFDAAATLRLAEYAIIHHALIKKHQKSLPYNKNYCEWVINSVDTSFTKLIARRASSEIVQEVLANRLNRPENDKSGHSGVSYYFKNNQYHIFYNGYKVKDSVLLVVDNIYQFKVISSNEAIVFDTDSTFYYIQGVNNPYASRRWTIQDKRDFYRPYNIDKTGLHQITFSFYHYSNEQGIQPRERKLGYRSDTKELIQDLDKKTHR